MISIKMISLAAAICAVAVAVPLAPDFNAARLDDVELNSVILSKPSGSGVKPTEKPEKPDTPKPSGSGVKPTEKPEKRETPKPSGSGVKPTEKPEAPKGSGSGSGRHAEEETTSDLQLAAEARARLAATKTFTCTVTDATIAKKNLAALAADADGKKFVTLSDKWVASSSKAADGKFTFTSVLPTAVKSTCAKYFGFVCSSWNYSYKDCPTTPNDYTDACAAVLGSLEFANAATVSGKAALSADGNTLTFTKTGGNLASADFSLSLSGTTVTGKMTVDIYGMLSLWYQGKLAVADAASAVLSIFGVGTDQVFAPNVCKALSKAL